MSDIAIIAIGLGQLAFGFFLGWVVGLRRGFDHGWAASRGEAQR
jgi:hypothetical protein